MKIYIDFDRTLFDCDSFLSDLYSIILEYKIPRNIFKSCQNQCKKMGFNPYSILNEVNKLYSFDVSIYEKIDKLLSKTNSYLYSDSVSFLKYLKDRNYQIIILTKGNMEYQMKKIKNSNISNYYNDVIVTMLHKGKLDLDYSNSIFIDDNPVEIKSILRKKPKKLIRIKRDKSKYSNISLDKKVEIVNNLKEIINNKVI